ncbi:MAG: hypothetical protein IH964_05660 [Candidatus Dadabacteria bacterium]|nr:hypothetical protein [Candidatus Dadabacteria bacterium]
MTRDINIEKRKSIDRILDKYSSDLKYGEVIISFKKGEIIYIKSSEIVEHMHPHKEKDKVSSIEVNERVEKDRIKK